MYHYIIKTNKLLINLNKIILLLKHFPIILPCCYNIIYFCNENVLEAIFYWKY